MDGDDDDANINANANSNQEVGVVHTEGLENVHDNQEVELDTQNIYCPEAVNMQEEDGESIYSNPLIDEELQNIDEDMEEFLNEVLKEHDIRGHGSSPSDAQLIQEYLTFKLSHQPNPHLEVTPVDVEFFNNHPQELYESYKQLAGPGNEIYFFTKRNAKKSGRIDRKAKGGFWKPSCSLPIISNGATIGHKRYTIFYEGANKTCAKTDYVMHEYRVNDDIKADEFILCKFYMKSNKVCKRKRAQDTTSMFENLQNGIEGIQFQLHQLEQQVQVVRNSQERIEAQLQALTTKLLQQHPPQNEPPPPHTTPELQHQPDHGTSYKS